VAPSARRLVTLDALRGFALLGIIQINLPAFLAGADPLYVLLGRSENFGDWWAFALASFLVEAKFYPLFAFLFGYGFGLQWQALANRPLLRQRLLKRRYLFLFGLGVLHGLMLFFGDILTMYAISGFVLLATMPEERPILRRRIVMWLALSILLTLAQSVAPGAFEGQPGGAPMQERVAASIAEIAHGPFLPAAAERAEDYVLAQLYQLGTFLPQLLFFMSLGAYAARLGVFRRSARFPGLWRRCLTVGIVAGIPVNLVLTWSQLQEAPGGDASHAVQIAALCGYAGAFLQTPLYVALLVWASQRAASSPLAAFVVAALARLGRLALTGYLLQSLLMLLILSSAGLGWAERLSLVELGLLGLFIAGLELVAAWLYLTRFTIGPCEWLWRRYVYAGIDPPGPSQN
jgi:uncharacterized protein